MFKCLVNNNFIANQSHDKYLIGTIDSGGFGAMYARRKLIIQLAHIFNRIPIFRYENYLYDDPFELTNIHLHDVRYVKQFRFTDTNEQFVFFDFNSYWNSEYVHKYQCWHPKDTEYLFYCGFLYSLLNIKTTYLDKIHNLISSIQSDNNINSFDNVIGLHLRRGDKITETKYLDENIAFQLINKIDPENTCSIFIASDEENYIKEIISKYPYNFIYDKNEKRYGDKKISNVQLVQNNPSIKKQETLTFMKNMIILQKCRYIIGSHSTQMTKIAGSIASYMSHTNKLYLINTLSNKLDFMGSSLATS